jgi:hypothetical protein
VRYFVTDASPTFASTVGGGRSLVRGDPAAVVPVREPLPAAAVEIASRLDGATGVGDGEAVGTLTLVGVDGATWDLTVPAGEHQRARFDLTPFGRPAIREVRLLAVRPGVRWDVDRVVLYTPFEARFRLAQAEGDLRIWENPKALPRAWWVGRYVLADDPAGALERLKEGSVDPAGTAVLAAPVPGLTPGAGPAPEVGGQPPRTIEQTANRRLYEVDAPAPGLLVISETLAPGWRASLDGQPVALYPADGSFQAVAVPAGRHRVELRYLPVSVVLGAGISLVSVALLVGVALVDRLRRKAAEHAAQPPGQALDPGADPLGQGPAVREVVGRHVHGGTLR